MPGTRVVIPSSAAVYGAARQLPIAESAVLDPVSPYGTHKMVTEHMARSYARQYGVNIALVVLLKLAVIGFQHFNCRLDLSVCG